MKELSGFAVVRIDDFQDPALKPEHRIKVTRIVWTAEDAKGEVERLSKLNESKGVRYFSSPTRVDEPPSGS